MRVFGRNQSTARVAQVDRLLQDYARQVPGAQSVPVLGNIGAGQVVSGTLDNDRLGSAVLVQTDDQATVGAAGGAAALPATPSGYLVVNIGGTDRAIPYYDVS